MSEILLLLEVNPGNHYMNLRAVIKNITNPT